MVGLLRDVLNQELIEFVLNSIYWVYGLRHLDDFAKFRNDGLKSKPLKEVHSLILNMILILKLFWEPRVWFHIHFLVRKQKGESV